MTAIQPEFFMEHKLLRIRDLYIRCYFPIYALNLFMYFFMYVCNLDIIICVYN